jgi:hypothetical protein
MQIVPSGMSIGAGNVSGLKRWVGSSVADPGCFIPDPGSGSLTFSSRIRILGVKKHRIPKNITCGSGIRIPDPEVKKHRIRIRNTG